MVNRSDLVRRWNELFEDARIKERIDVIVEKYPDTASLTLAYDDLNSHDLFDCMKKPGEVLACGVEVLVGHINDHIGQDTRIELHNIFIRPAFGYMWTTISRIGHRYLGELIEFEGIVRRRSEVRAQLARAVYRCKRCGGEFVWSGGDLICTLCERSGPFDLLKDRSGFVDVQRLLIHEPYDQITGVGEPKSIEVIVKGDIVDTATPGERVRVVGIVDLLSLGKDTRGRLVEFRPIVEGLYIESQESREMDISEADIEKIRSAAADPAILSNLVRSVAPSILGHEWIKLALLMQQVGGKFIRNSDGTTSRGDIHILLAGDPSTGKSTLLSFVAEISPRAVRAAGGGVSGVGLTAAVVRDDDEWVLEAGVLPLASGGIAIVDEFDKMSEDDRNHLHEALEHGEIHIDKASIHAVLPARCALLAAANPKHGRFDPYEPLAAQINLKEALLSRFDLIFACRDVPDEQRDREIAEHILSGAEAANPVFDTGFLRKYLAHARGLNPVMNRECEERLASYYQELRRKGTSTGYYPIYPRALRSLKRLAEASARLRLSEEITRDDAENAIRVYEAAFRPLIGEDTGDMDILEIGVSSQMRDRIASVLGIIRDLEMNGGATLSEIKKKAGEMGIPERDLLNILDRLKRCGDVYELRGVFRTS